MAAPDPAKPRGARRSRPCPSSTGRHRGGAVQISPSTTSTGRQTASPLGPARIGRSTSTGCSIIAASSISPEIAGSVRPKFLASVSLIRRMASQLGVHLHQERVQHLARPADLQVFDHHRLAPRLSKHRSAPFVKWSSWGCERSSRLCEVMAAPGASFTHHLAKSFARIRRRRTRQVKPARRVAKRCRPSLIQPPWSDRKSPIRPRPRPGVFKRWVSIF